VEHRAPKAPITPFEAKVYDLAYKEFMKHLAPTLRATELTKEEFINLARTPLEDPTVKHDRKVRSIIVFVDWIARAEEQKERSQVIQLLNKLG
jgi:hypothetical protein